MKDVPKPLRGLQARWQQLWNDEKRRINFLLALGLAGMMLLCFSEWLPGGSAAEEPAAAAGAQAEEPAAYARELEDRLAELIGRMEGAGRTRVLVTLAAGPQTSYAANTERTADSQRREYVQMDGGALVEQVASPQLLGVAVVCEGGDDPGVQATVTELVDALTDVGANHITVTKMSDEP